MAKISRKCVICGDRYSLDAGKAIRIKRRLVACENCSDLVSILSCESIMFVEPFILHKSKESTVKRTHKIKMIRSLTRNKSSCNLKRLAKFNHTRQIDSFRILLLHVVDKKEQDYEMMVVHNMLDSIPAHFFPEGQVESLDQILVHIFKPDMQPFVLHFTPKTFKVFEKSYIHFAENNEEDCKWIGEDLLSSFRALSVTSSLSEMSHFVHLFHIMYVYDTPEDAVWDYYGVYDIYDGVWRDCKEDFC